MQIFDWILKGINDKVFGLLLQTCEENNDYSSQIKTETISVFVADQQNLDGRLVWAKRRHPKQPSRFKKEILFAI